VKGMLKNIGISDNQQRERLGDIKTPGEKATLRAINQLLQ
jgi:hypothetical protein